jgi:tetratricopeptide (TPR) repeat protein
MVRKSTGKKPRSGIRQWPVLILAALSALAYVNTIPNEYALDDIYSITRNDFTRQGLEGIPDLLGKHYFAGYLGDQEVALTGGRYRPLSLITFAIEYEFLGENPHFSHFLNLLLYALMVVVAYRVLSRIFPPGKQWYYAPLFLGMLLYSVHPVHTEVVANIKGRDEILAGLFSLLALRSAFRMKEKGGWLPVVGMMTWFFLALMSKENAAAFLIIIPLSLYFSGSKRPAFLLRQGLWLFLPLALFALIRFWVLGGISTEASSELMDNPFLHASLSERYGTIFRTFGDYFRLMVYPAVLTWDYYPYHIPLTPLLSWHALLPLAITLALLVHALRKLKSRTMDSYGILFFFLGFFMVSNLVFNVGAFMAERFIFLPSLGLCLAMGYGAVELRARLSPEKKGLVPALIGVMLIFFLYKTLERNQVWKDDFTLYTHDVQVSANSAKSNLIAAKFYAWEAGQEEEDAQKAFLFDQALFHFGRAVDIHPAYMDAWFHFGNTWYTARGELDSTLQCYGRVLALDKDEPNVWHNLERLAAAGARESRMKVQRFMMEWRSPEAKDLSAYAELLLAGGEQEEALPYLKKSLEADSTQARLWDHLGVIYYQQNDFPQAAGAFSRAAALEPENPRHRQNMYNTLLRAGKVQEARKWMPAPGEAASVEGKRE